MFILFMFFKHTTVAKYLNQGCEYVLFTTVNFTIGFNFSQETVIALFRGKGVGKGLTCNLGRNQHSARTGMIFAPWKNTTTN